MKPSGIITNYFPFIPSVHHEYLEGLVRSAHDYRDFVTSVTESIIHDDSLIDLIPFAIKWIWILGDYQLLEHMSNRFGEKITSLPWTLHALYYIGQLPDVDLTIGQIRSFLNAQTEKWLQAESMILLSLVMSEKYPDKALEVLFDAERLISSNEQLNPLMAMVLYSKGDAIAAKTKDDSCMPILQEALRLSGLYDDPYVKSNVLLQMSVFAKTAKRALDYLDESRILFHDLGCTVFENIIENNIGFYKVALAEYDDAIEHYLRSIMLSKELGMSLYNPYLNLSVLYGTLGKVDLSLQYSKEALEISKKTDIPNSAPYIEMARALVLSGRIDEAYEYLETGGEIVFKSPSQKELCRYYLVRGMLESARGDYPQAVSSLNRGLRIADSRGEIYYILQILLQLAGAEILAAAEQPSKKDSATSVALVRLEQLAEEQGLLGLSVQVLLLKAEVDALEGRKDRAEEKLREALDISATEGLKSLGEKTKSRLAEMNRSGTRLTLLERIKKMIHQIAIPSGHAKRIHFELMGCIVIYQNAGLEVYSKYVDPKLTSDPSLVAGLISAVSSFTREIREDTTGNLQSIIHQDIAVLLEHGRYVTCALLVDRDTYEARLRERRFLERFEETFAKSLIQFQDGMIQPLDGDTIFTTILLQREFGD